jgi:hypothetical protein
MNKEFVPYEESLELKELGFDEPCLAQYRKYDVGEATLDIGFSKNEIISKFDNLVLFCSTPLYQQAFRWFREKHKLFHSITEYNKDGSLIIKLSKDKVEIFRKMTNFDFTEYEETELTCLKKLIEITKDLAVVK